MKNALFVLSGNCRTFMDCIDNISTNMFFKLFTEDVNIYIYLYLKLTDPGPKGQKNWDFEYKDNDYNTILNKIYNIKSKHPKLKVDYKLLNGDEISPGELISQVKNRSLYKGFYSEDTKLIRGLNCHYNLEKCGNYILEKEKSIQCKFDYIIYVRPDLFFTDCCNHIDTYNTSIVTLGAGPNVYNDHLAIVPREHLHAFFFDRMNVYRNNTCKIFTEAEGVYYDTITYEVKPIGKYFIKRF